MGSTCKLPRPRSGHAGRSRQRLRAHGSAIAERIALPDSFRPVSRSVAFSQDAADILPKQGPAANRSQPDGSHVSQAASQVRQAG